MIKLLKNNIIYEATDVEIYPNKAFTYLSGKLTNVTVS